MKGWIVNGQVAGVLVRLAMMIVMASIAGTAIGLLEAEAETSPEFVFDIPSQPLEAALDAFGASSRTQVLYETSFATGRRSSPVKGLHAPAAALRLLLRGTGLDFNYTAERAITLVSAKSEEIDATAEARRRTDIAKFDRFLGGVQAGIITGMCRQHGAHPGDFEVAMQFRISGAGAVVNPVLLASTGSPVRDRAILGVLSRLAFSEAPPPDMPQPIAMRMTNPGSSYGRTICADATRG